LPTCEGSHEDTLLALADHLPAEAAEALLELATGGKPRVLRTQWPTANPFDHPDAQRRFRVMTNVEELETALDFPWEKWTVFLHPEQRQWVERDYNGPARVSGIRGHGQDHRGAAPRRLPGAQQSRCTSVAGHLLGHPGHAHCTPSSSASLAMSRAWASVIDVVSLD
jgi:hypothetical protein